MLRKFAVVMAAVLAVQSVAAVRTEPKLKPEHSPVVLNQKLEGSWKWEVTFDIFEGLVQGFFEYDKYPNLKQCASDITEVYDGEFSRPATLRGCGRGHGPRLTLPLFSISLHQIWTRPSRTSSRRASTESRRASSSSESPSPRCLTPSPTAREP